MFCCRSSWEPQDRVTSGLQKEANIFTVERYTSGTQFIPVSKYPSRSPSKEPFFILEKTKRNRLAYSSQIISLGQSCYKHIAQSLPILIPFCLHHARLSSEFSSVLKFPLSYCHHCLSQVLLLQGLLPPLFLGEPESTSAQLPSLNHELCFAIPMVSRTSSSLRSLTLFRYSLRKPSL